MALPKHSRIAVIGGGITGLSAAFRLHELTLERNLDVSVTILESDARLGGQIRTDRLDGCLVEAGADSLVLAKPAGASLCERLDLSDELVRLHRATRRTQILHRGRLVDLPDGFQMMAPTRLGAFLASPLFSARGKLRILAERFIRPADSGTDESLGAFVGRRFGRELLERVAEPILGSLFTADADRLSVDTAFPRLREMERRHGSVTRAIEQAARNRAQAAAGKHGLAYSDVGYLQGGFESLIRALRSSLPPAWVRTGVRPQAVLPHPDGWEIVAPGEERRIVDAIVFACPAHATAPLFQEVDSRIMKELASLTYAPCATVSLVYRDSDVARRPESFGFFVPRGERGPLLAVSFVSIKIPDRAPRGRILLRAFLGGALHPEILDHGDDELARLTHDRLRSLLKLRAEPVAHATYRFPRAMPQYEVGFAARRVAMEKRLETAPGLYLAGSAVGAVGIPDCIASGERAAGRALEHVEAVRHERSSGRGARPIATS